ncbi:MAG: caspase family protein [Oculatellaceae cyanobacterium Prado106]|nr:caspase family protein [Oculatellaceae cyanobacterium Prado106]
MANYWAIAIGINQYQSFQPLIYAQRDAQQFWDFMSQEGGFGDDHCLLMTDGTSAPDHITYPNRGNIQSRVLQVCQQILKPGDLLWVFFSGYGVRHEGKDYLMPVEGDPAKVAATGVAMESLYRILNTAPTDNVILTLDMNRSQSVLAGEGVGEQIVALAKQYGIATLLSCRPNQFSHETLALRQGLFTTALIEAMRYQGCVTLEQLVQYLGDRLPELSEHHWRPPQEPDAFIPPEKEYLLIVPEQAATNLGNRPPVNFAPSYAIATTSTLAAMTSTSGPSLPPILPLTAPNTSTALPQTCSRAPPRLLLENLPNPPPQPVPPRVSLRPNRLRPLGIPKRVRWLLRFPQKATIGWTIHFCGSC